MLGFKEFNTLKTMLENSDADNYISVCDSYGDEFKVEKIRLQFVFETDGDPVTVETFEELKENVKQVSKLDIF